MRKPKPSKIGLRIAWHAHVEKYRGTKIDAADGQGWYIEAWLAHERQWKAIIDLRFLRQLDALRALENLTRHCIDNYQRLTKAGLPRVKQLACEFLQW